MDLDTKITDIVYEHMATAPTAPGTSAAAIVKDVTDAVRGLEEENQKLRDTIAARIVEEEQKLQADIAIDPTSEWLNGRLSGYQHARDIAKEEK